MEYVANSTVDTINKGSIIQGEVVTIDDEFAYISVGTKSEGRVSLMEFESSPSVGDIVDIMLMERKLFDGMYLFSTLAAEKEKKWQSFMESYSDGNEYLTASIVNTVKNGMIVDCYGIDAFLPYSQADDLMFKFKKGEKGPYKFKIKSVDKKKKNIVLTRKEYIQEESEKKWGSFIENYKAGDIVKGIPVKFIESGVVIDINGVKAFVTKGDLSWRKVFKKKNLLKAGEEKEFMILEINQEKKNVSLGLKQLQEDPWLKINDNYKVDDEVKGTVVTLTSFGAFIEIQEGIEGLLNSSNISWTRKNVNPKEYFKKGQEVQVKMLSINKDERKLSLGIKQLLPNPWDTIEERFPVGSIHSREIKKIVNFGMFIKLEKDIEGMIHVSDFSWDESIKNPGNQFKEGDTVEFKILEINKAEMKVSCGIKQLHKSPWELIKEKYPPRSKVSGNISGIVQFGVFVKLEDAVEGLVHVSELSRKKIDNPEEFFKMGDKVNAIVLGVDVAKKRLSLSVKHFEIIAEKEELNKVLNNPSSSMATIGDILKGKLDK